jgi:thioesterase domain-containing protein/NAD(P)-dependent dehydrogenase (short-subunit alcohol dehydrogenase family)/acyl carrier protein
MVAISQSETEVARWLNDGISLAAVNSREQCVVSGPLEAIVALESRLQKEEITFQRLETSHAFHSSAVEPILEEFTELVRKTQLSPPLIPLISNVTGTWMTDQDATDPAYWARHFRETIRFGDGLAVLQSAPGSYLIEIGPGETLASLGRQHASREMRQRTFPSLPRQDEKNGDLSTMLTALGNMWVHGAEIDWQAFHAHEKLRRIPLPTYPFQRKSYWIGPKLGTNWLPDSIGKVDDWFSRVVWKSTPLPAPSSTPGTWLVLCDSSPESEKIVAEFRGQKAEVVTVVPGAAFQVTGETSYAMNLSSENNYRLLFDQLAQRKQVPRHIVHLWGLRPAPNGEDRCFHSLLFLIQMWGARHPEQPVAITAYSHGSLSVHNELVIHPYGSLLAGPCRVAPLEYPTVRCRQVDVDSIEPRTLAEIIRREGEMGNEPDPAGSLAVYRSGNRWTQEVERFSPEPMASRLREGGTYLITGGLGGLGMAVADSLARSRHARLILISRHADSPDADHEARFAEWRHLGAEVLVLSADVTNRESLSAALAQARKKFGPLHGIIHAAGVLQDGIIQLKKKASAHSVLAPKVEGVQLLDELTRGQHLDFFALFSSVSAMSPPDGQVDYCAANSFLTAYAQSRPADRNFVVIAWAPWAEIGMVAPKPEAVREADPSSPEQADLDPSTRTIYPGSKPLTGITTREGLGAFHRIMGSRSPNVIFVSPVSLSPTAPMKESETLAGSVTASDDDIELVLTQLWERLLGLKQVNVNTDFFDSGGHSLLAVRLFTEIRKRFDINFGLSTLFEARTIRALADLIRKAQKASPSEKNAYGSPAIVSIRAGGSTTPLFLIHDVGGGVLRYEHLARHFPDNQSIFAIESRGLSGLPADFTVEDMARHYVEQIRERQPNGPYYVAGHSFGGMVTYEIARQLKAQNETMGLVGLLDTYQRNITEADALQQTDAPARIGKLPIFQRLKKDIEAILLGQDRVRYLLERQTFLNAWALKTLYRNVHKWTTRLGWPMPRFMNNVKEANWIALDHFTPKPYDGPVVLFQCLDRLDTDFPDSSHVWKRLISGEVTVIGVPGDHNSILKEPGVSVLAKQMLSFLETGKPSPAESKSAR